MGHAYPANISHHVNKTLRASETVTIKDIVDELETKKTVLSCAEGGYTERYMLALMVEEIFARLWDANLVAPAKLSRKQRAVFRQWDNGDIAHWDSGDDGEGGEYGLFDSIQWYGLAQRYPVISHIEN